MEEKGRRREVKCEEGKKEEKWRMRGKEEKKKTFLISVICNSLIRSDVSLFSSAHELGK